MNRLSRLNFIAEREAAIVTPPVQEVQKKDDPALQLVNQSVLCFFPSEVRHAMEHALETGESATIKFMGKDFTHKEILRLSNAVKGTLLSFYLNLESQREIAEMTCEQSLLDAILTEDDDEDPSEAWKYQN
jgi:hypothetical protein